jgi:hypothetical protein
MRKLPIFFVLTLLGIGCGSKNHTGKTINDPDSLFIRTTLPAIYGEFCSNTMTIQKIQGHFTGPHQTGIDSNGISWILFHQDTSQKSVKIEISIFNGSESVSSVRILFPFGKWKVDNFVSVLGHFIPSGGPQAKEYSFGKYSSGTNCSPQIRILATLYTLDGSLDEILFSK